MENLQKHRGNLTFSELLTKAEADDPVAMRELALAYVNGQGVDQNLEKAEHWIEKAASLGDAEAQHEMADVIRATDGDPVEAFRWEQKAAEQGFPPAQNNLAFCFQNGTGTTKNPEKQFFWYQKAAENGITESQHQLAQCFLHGIGTSQDFQQAIYWLQQASDGGHAIAKRKLGAAYMQGMGVAIDNEKGLALLNEAASMGDQTAKELLMSGGRSSGSGGCLMLIAILGASLITTACGLAFFVAVGMF